MLKSLKISGLAVINSLEVDFHPGLNVLTGETGSGKSIIVDALGLLLGERGSSAQIRTGETKASIEGLFTLTDGVDAELCEVLKLIGLENSLELIIHREIHITGKGRISINGISVVVGILRKLQPFLSEIYGQGEQRSLLSASSHRDLLDHFGGCASLKNDVRKLYLLLKSTEGDLKSLVSILVEREQSKDLIQHQLTEINALNPKRGEDDELLAEREILAHAEKIIELASSAYYNLYESDDSIISRLSLIRRQLNELGCFVEDARIALDSLLTGIVSLTDVAESIRRYASGLEGSPARLAAVEARLSDLEKVKRKYGTNLDGIIEIKNELLRNLSQSSELAEQVDALRKAIGELRTDYMESAGKLSACRRAKAPSLEQSVMAGLHRVAMEQARFIVSIETRAMEDNEQEVGIFSAEAIENSSSTFFTSGGIDRVEFLLTANPGESPRPLSYVASGGELSRLMLVLRVASQEVVNSEAVVFDEIDAGVGGSVAEAVGHLLKSLSTSRQVFCVTHQLQIAKFADHHFVVTKEIENGRTHAGIRELTTEERVSELARMIGGDGDVEITREAAQWLLENAKNSNRRRTKR